MLNTHQTLRRFLPVLALLVAVGGAIMACGGTDNSGASTTGGSSSSGSTATHFKVGDQVKVGDTWVVTLNSVTTHGSTDVDQLKSGDTYLVFDMTFQNVSSDTQLLATSAQLSLEDSTKLTYQQAFVTFVDTPPDGNIAAGGHARGKMVYEVPKAEKSFTLAFQSDTITPGSTIWDIKL